MEKDIEIIIKNSELDTNLILNLSNFKKRYILNEFLKKNGAEGSRKIIEKIIELINHGGSITYNLPNRKAVKISYNTLTVVSQEEKMEVISEKKLKIGSSTYYGNY